MHDPTLGVVHLFANFVTQDFIPVDLGACNRQLATQGLKGRVRHCLVVLIDCSLGAKKRKRKKENPNFTHACSPFKVHSVHYSLI